MLHNGKNKKEVFVRSSFFLVILYIFSKLWQATAGVADQQLMVWYLSVTELIVLSIPLVQVDIEDDIRSGDIVYQVLKPISYLWLKISDSIGAFLFRFTLLMGIAIPFCTYLSGFTPSFFILASAYLAAFFAGLVFILFHTSIGLLAFRLQDSTSIFWVWQRCSFLFGGLVIPLEFYPSYLKAASYFLPFASLLYGPARLVLEFNIENVLVTLGGLIFWGGAGLFLSKRLYVLMLRSLKINGG
jgi:ABC-2 type transport system permease protein